MKVRPSVKRMCSKCKIIRRKGVVTGDLRKPETQAAPGLIEEGPWHALQVLICHPTRGSRSV